MLTGGGGVGEPSNLASGLVAEEEVGWLGGLGASFLLLLNVLALGLHGGKKKSKKSNLASWW